MDPDLDKPKPAHEFLSTHDKDIYEACRPFVLFISIYDVDLDYAFVDDPATFKNAPVGLQLVGRTLEDEGVIAMTEIVDAALKTACAKL